MMIFLKSCEFTDVYEALPVSCAEVMYIAFPLKGTPQHRMKGIRQITVEITFVQWLGGSPTGQHSNPPTT